MNDGARKLYVRETQGRYATLRWTCVWLTQIVFYGLPWLYWNGRQIVLFDLGARKFYLFGIVLVPQDLIYLAALLIMAATALFLSSAIVGRIWCGFACPHTVYTEIFMWIERRIEGGRSARMRLDREGASRAKLAKKTLKHALWALAALWTGITFVAYFTPVRALLGGLATATLAPWEWLWIGLYGLLAYGNAGWMREQICKYICPYARFQSTMFDRDTLIITYDAARGEPRGLRNRKQLERKAAQGDCIDCTICVQVCPTGNDIRHGLHYDCTGCAACIDACNAVMARIGAPPGLVRYTSENALARDLSPAQMRRAILRPRVLVYGLVVGLLAALFAASLIRRVPLRLDVVRDRGAPVHDAAAGVIENVYRLQIENTDERAHRYTIAVSGIETIALAAPVQVELDGAAMRSVPVRVRVAAERARPGSHPIVFEVKERDAARMRVTETAVFLAPPPGASSETASSLLKN